MFKLIIRNELKKRLHREPTIAEWDAAYADIIDNTDETCVLADVIACLDDHIANEYTQCEQCGEYHLNTEMQTISGPEGWQKVCNNPDCEQCAYTDVNYNKCRDWATY